MQSLQIKHYFITTDHENLSIMLLSTKISESHKHKVQVYYCYSQYRHAATPKLIYIILVAIIVTASSHVRTK